MWRVVSCGVVLGGVEGRAGALLARLQRVWLSVIVDFLLLELLENPEVILIALITWFAISSLLIQNTLLILKLLLQRAWWKQLLLR